LIEAGKYRSVSTPTRDGIVHIIEDEVQKSETCSRAKALLAQGIRHHQRAMPVKAAVPATCEQGAAIHLSYLGGLDESHPDRPIEWAIVNR